jgi:hypothetical protein
MAAIEIISDIEEIIKVSWSNFQPDGVAPFKLSERSPVSPALFATNLPEAPTQVLNIHRITLIDHHPVEHDEDRATEYISVTKNWLN